MTVQWWLKRAQQLLDEMNDIDFGYPFGANLIRPPKPSGVVQETLVAIGLQSDTPLGEFYSHCDGISLPDVHSGYFIEPLARVAMSLPDISPNEITGPFAGKALAFGSTGGGGHFVLRLAENDVLYLPPGALHNGVYDGAQSKVKYLAPDFHAFLRLLLEDIKAFVGGMPHRFLA